ncbi:MAG: ferritin-like domain-containing protein [Candidatus Bathyarchaeota archaeon]|nr:ferritin-like domain-containing protein [Candidatus Bathyarchaeota archaeon]
MSEPMKMTPDSVSLLNKAVSRELQVSVQYMLQHTKMEKLIRKVIPENILLDKTTYEAMGKFLREFAIQEMKHAAAIMERIYYLGGEATTKSDKPIVGNTLSEFAQNGVKAEEEALVLYRKIIEAAGKNGDWETRELFEKIYAEEEAHLFKFQEYVNMKDEPEGPEPPLSEWRKIFTNDYFTMLNKAAASEISAVIQYTNQHEKASLLVLRKKSTALEIVTEANKAKVVSELLKEVFMQEMEHLEKISERIYLLEGETTSVPDPLPQVGKTADDFLKLDHAAENDAILLYRKIIEEAFKRGDTTTRRMFEEIVLQEEEHYWKFDDFLK